MYVKGMLGETSPVGEEMNTKIGFTGTQRGMNQVQLEKLLEMLTRLGMEFTITEAHHGDCIGADAQFHELVRELLPKTYIVIHPPDNPTKRANCHGDVILQEKPYLERDLDIVLAIDILIATPKEMPDARPKSNRGSGTWTTIGYAEKRRKIRQILWPI